MSMRRCEASPRTRIVFDQDQIILHPGSGGKLVPISPEGMKSLSDLTGYPITLNKKLSTGTAQAAMSELLRRQEEYCIFTKDGQVNGFYQAKKIHPIDPERIVSQTEKAIPGAGFIRVLVERDKLIGRLEVMGERRVPVEGSALENDIIAGGSIIKFSPTGTIAPTIQSYVLRIWCTNGCATPVFTESFAYGSGGGGGEGDNMWQWFRQSCRKSYQGVTKIAAQFSRLAGENISPEDRAAILETMLQSAGLHDKAAAGVRAEALRNPPQNSWDMMNLITYASSHLMSEPKRIYHAENSVTKFITETSHARTCPMCHRGEPHRQLPAHGNDTASTTEAG
jgi:hypothetical protein